MASTADTISQDRADATAYSHVSPVAKMLGAEKTQEIINQVNNVKTPVATVSKEVKALYDQFYTYMAEQSTSLQDYAKSSISKIADLRTRMSLCLDANMAMQMLMLMGLYAMGSNAPDTSEIANQAMMAGMVFSPNIGSTLLAIKKGAANHWKVISSLTVGGAAFLLSGTATPIVTFGVVFTSLWVLFNSTLVRNSKSGWEKRILNVYNKMLNPAELNKESTLIAAMNLQNIFSMTMLLEGLDKAQSAFSGEMERILNSKDGEAELVKNLQQYFLEGVSGLERTLESINGIVPDMAFTQIDGIGEKEAKDIYKKLETLGFITNGKITVKNNETIEQAILTSGNKIHSDPKTEQKIIDLLSQYQLSLESDAAYMPKYNELMKIIQSIQSNENVTDADRAKAKNIIIEMINDTRKLNPELSDLIDPIENLLNNNGNTSIEELRKEVGEMAKKFDSYFSEINKTHYNKIHGKFGAVNRIKALKAMNMLCMAMFTYSLAINPLLIGINPVNYLGGMIFLYAPIMYFLVDGVINYYNNLQSFFNQNIEKYGTNHLSPYDQFFHTAFRYAFPNTEIDWQIKDYENHVEMDGNYVPVNMVGSKFPLLRPEQIGYIFMINSSNVRRKLLIERSGENGKRKN